MRAYHLLIGVAAIAALGACADDDEPGEQATPTAMSSRMTAVDVAAVELVTGDCISGLVIGEAERTTTDSVRVVDCNAVHELEIFASFDLAPADFEDTEGDAYPGEQRVVREADQGCAARLERLGAEDRFGLIAMWPTSTSWLEGDRSVKCAAFPMDGGPFEGSGLLALEEP